jgi:hypothetical protein
MKSSSGSYRCEAVYCAAFWGRITARRKAGEGHGRKRLREADSGNRLTIDRNNERLDLA